MIPYVILVFAFFLAFVIIPIVEYYEQKKRDNSWDKYINSPNENKLDEIIKP